MTEASERNRPDAAIKPAGRARFRLGALHFSVAGFLGAEVLLIVTAPLVQEIPGARYIEAALISLMLLTAVLAVGGRRRTFMVAIVLAVPAFIARWVEHFWPGDKLLAFSVACFLLFLGFIVFQFLRFILRSPRVTSEVLCPLTHG